MLNLQTHLLWASSRQHECGIKHNKLWVSLAFDHASMSMTTSVCTSVYWCRIYIYIIHIWICVYEFMNKVFFQTHECMSLWIKSVFPDSPFQDGHKLVYWFVQLQTGCSLLILCVLMLCRLLLGSIFLKHISIKSTHTWFMYSFMAQAGYC